jgi:hypothetical protein
MQRRQTINAINAINANNYDTDINSNNYTKYLYSSIPITIDNDFLKDKQMAILKSQDEDHDSRGRHKSSIIKSKDNTLDKSNSDNYDISDNVDFTTKLINSIKQINSNKQRRSVFISVDSRYRDRHHRLINGLYYKLALYQSSTTQGVIGLTNPLSQVTELEIMDSFVFPKNSSGDTSLNDNYFNEITLLINELYNQSYIGPKNRFHFTFNIQPLQNDSNRYLLPISYNNIYQLAQPYNIDKTLTFRFFSPSISANFDDDVYQCYVYYTNPAQIEIAGPLDPVTGRLSSTLNSANDFIAFEDFSSSFLEYNSNTSSSVFYSEKFYNVGLTADPYIFTIPIDLLNSSLKADVTVPRGNPYTLAKNPTLMWDDPRNGFLTFATNYQQIAKVGDILKISSITANIPPSNQTNYNLLTNSNGYVITNVDKIVETSNNSYLYTYYAYTITFNINTHPIWNTTPEISSILGSFTLVNKPDPVKTTTIYVGSRRIRFTLRAETIVKDK